MAATELTSKTYRPSMQVGQVYARPYGSTAALAEIGNVLELTIEHAEDVKRQTDMTKLGGGVHAEVRRVTDVTLKMKLADLNITNLARATLGTVSGVDSGDITDEAHDAVLGGLIRLAHIAATDVVVKKGADSATATPVVEKDNYVIRPEGIFILANAAGILAADKLWVSYSYGDQAVIEALTTKTPELEFVFGGLNEADGGAPCVLEIFRASQSITKQLALINDNFGALDVEGSVLKDATKVGTGVSQYYKQTIAAAVAA
ncbi:MAG: hypothetical protein EPN34_03045 [Burkholderiaceae bacterium]|nr:MAG: hypothetical protein EPN34_03045 [Burkholderiaceae bacterium]